MKIISWNLNGLMPTLNSGAFDAFAANPPDVLCLQEIRTREEPIIIGDCYHYWNHGKKEGYSGTAVLTREEPLYVAYDFPPRLFDDHEGRLITLEFPAVFILNVYVPNAQKNLERQAYRMRWDAALQKYVEVLLGEKSVILCGDFNVTRSFLDVFEENMRQYWASQGYASDTQSNFESLLELGLTDVYRALYPNERSYTWWSNRMQKRKDNRGWRLDYFLVSDDLLPCVMNIEHLSAIQGSDHCPIALEVDL